MRLVPEAEIAGEDAEDTRLLREWAAALGRRLDLLTQILAERG